MSSSPDSSLWVALGKSLLVVLFLLLGSEHPIFAQYSSSKPSVTSNNQFSDFMSPDFSCNCGTPVTGGSVPVTDFPDCGEDGNYPNEFTLNLEFLGGGSNIDPAALEDKYWMIQFRNLDNLCAVWTFPFTIGDSLYQVERTGNSIKVSIQYSDLDSDNTCTTQGFEGYNWDYRVVQICDYPLFDCYRLSVRDTFNMQLVQDMFDVASNNAHSIYTAPAKVQFGYCETDVLLDLLLGETLSLGNDSMDQHWNDVRSSLQYINVCGWDSELFPGTENYQIVLRDSLGNVVSQSFFDNLSMDVGDFVLMDTVWYQNQRCIRLTYKTDGDGNYNRWGVFASGELLDCTNAPTLRMDAMSPDDFRLSWNAGMQTTGHAFKIKIYQGGDCEGISADTARNRPNVDNTQILEAVLSWDDPRLTRTVVPGSSENGFVAQDNYMLQAADLGISLLPCTCYQVFVYQICDGMDPDGTDGFWAAAMGKTSRLELSCSAVVESLEVNSEICEVRGGGIGFLVPDVFCAAYEVDVYLSGPGVLDTFSYYSSGYKNGSPVSSDRAFGFIAGTGLAFSHQDTLMNGDYDISIEIRDTLNPGTAHRCSFSTSVALIDLLKPSMVISLEDYTTGPRFYLDDDGTITGNAAMIDDNAIDLGEIVLPPGSCGTDLDLLLDVYDECVLYYDKLIVTVENVSGTATGEVYQGADDTLRSAVVHLGAGDFVFDIQIQDGPDETTWNSARFRGSVKDQSAPIVQLPGNLVYQVGTCSDTLSVYFNLSASDACEGDIAISAANLTGLSELEELGNGLFRATGVAPGAYEVVVFGVQDASGNEAAVETFMIQVLSGGVASERQIVGPGDMQVLTTACQPVTKVSFDLFVVDACANTVAFDSIDAGAYSVEGNLSGNRFSIANLFAGDEIRVKAYSGSASYVFDINVSETIDVGVSEVVFPDELNFILPVCNLSGDYVSFAVKVKNACSDPEFMLLATHFFLGEEEVFPVNYSISGNSLTFQFRQRVSMADNHAFFEVQTLDLDQNTTTFKQVIRVWQEEASIDYTCGDQFNVLLGDNCSAIITPSMVLKGDEGAICNDQLQVIVEKRDALGDFEGYYTLNEVVNTGFFKYAVLPSGSEYLRYDNNRIIGVTSDAIVCWGSLLVEDKTPPVQVCPEDTYEGLVPVVYNSFSGQLLAERSFYPQVFSCYKTSGGTYLEYLNPNEPHYYHTQTFRPSKDGIYTITLNADFEAMLAIFQQHAGVYRSGWQGEGTDGWFDPAQPCSNIVSFGQAVSEAPDNLVYRLALPLRKGNEYTLLLSSIEAYETGAYEFTVSRDYSDEISASILEYWDPVLDTWGNESEQWTAFPVLHGEERLPLYCEDLSKVLIHPTEQRCYTVFPQVISSGLAAKIALTGFPEIRDNCGEVEVCVTDRVYKSGDCGELYLDRQFSLKDEYGNVGEACVQRIWFAVPSISNLTLPPFTQYLECDEGFALDAAGNPDPSLTGYPFLRSAFGYHNLAQEWCNLAAAYEDQAIINGCDQSVNIRRNWTILDWCRPGNSLLYNQLIKIGDYSAPEMDASSLIPDNAGLSKWGDTLTYSVSPFDCLATFEVPRPAATDNCSDWIEMSFEVQKEEEVLLYDPLGNLLGKELAWQTIREGYPGNYVRGLPVGKKYRYLYKVEDPCGNRSAITVPFQVLDLIEPIVACDDILTVTLGGGSWDLDNGLSEGGYARLEKEELQEGVLDHCGEVSYWVRRAVDGLCVGYFEAGELEVEVLEGKEVKYTPWASSVEFFCCDAGKRVAVEVKARDASGNESFCSLSVLVEDKVLPVCTAPSDYEGLCTVLPSSFNPPSTLTAYEGLSPVEKDYLHGELDRLFGVAEATDNCGAVRVVQELTQIAWHCGGGTLTRSFYGLDAFGNRSTGICTQLVQVNGVHEFAFTFPADEEWVSCGEETEQSDLELSEGGCDLLSVVVSDKRYEGDDSACFKLFRTYEVVNWCQFGGGDVALAQPFVVSRDEDGNDRPGDAAVIVSYREFESGNALESWTIIDSDREVSNGALRISDYDGGYYSYTQVIAVKDIVAPELELVLTAEYCSYATDCVGRVEAEVLVMDACSSDALMVEAYVWPLGGGGSKTLLELTDRDELERGWKLGLRGDLPIGEHALEVIVSDGCGNSNSLRDTIEVLDCKAPALSCLNAIAVELMAVDSSGDGTIDGGQMVVWAGDYVTDSRTDCSAPIRYSIHLNETSNPGQPSLLEQLQLLGDRPLWSVLDANQEYLELSCADAGSIREVILAAWDEAGNGSWCQTYLLVQDNSSLCGGSSGPVVAGRIATEANQAVEGVEVKLSGHSYDELVSGTDGTYRFSKLREGDDYTITPFLNGDYTNGVTTYDLIEIGKHILGVKSLDSPYKMIAADADNNRSITALDLVKLRRLILHVDTVLSNNTSWRFVDAGFDFSDPSDPWKDPFAELLNLNDLDESVLEGDFVAVKVGDVTLDAKANSLMSDNRGEGGVWQMEIIDASLGVGETYRVDVAGELSNLAGCQFTLNYDSESLELMEVTYGVAEAEHIGMKYAAEGMLTVSWNGTAREGALFGLLFRAKKPVNISEAMGVGSALTVAEAYDSRGSLLAVRMDFELERSAGGYALYQNIPNPFRKATVIGFYLPEDGEVTLTLTDITGKVRQVSQGRYRSGYNELELKIGDLLAEFGTGILYYTIEAEGFTATRKMVILR